MANMTEILKEINLKLEAEVKFVFNFRSDMEDFFPFFKNESKEVAEEVDIFADNLDIFEETTQNFVKEYFVIQNNIKKVSKKLSLSPLDINSLTQRVEKFTERSKIINEKIKIIYQKADVLKIKHLATLKLPKNIS